MVVVLTRQIAGAIIHRVTDGSGGCRDADLERAVVYACFRVNIFLPGKGGSFGRITDSQEAGHCVSVGSFDNFLYFVCLVGYGDGEYTPQSLFKSKYGDSPSVYRKSNKCGRCPSTCQGEVSESTADVDSNG